MSPTFEKVSHTMTPATLREIEKEMSRLPRKPSRSSMIEELVTEALNIRAAGRAGGQTQTR